MRYRRQRITLDEYEDEDGNLITDIADSVIHSHKTGIRDQSYDRKQFGENFAPLKRFIHSKVGKSWDKVYSEICKFCDKNGAVSGHIFDHLWDWVIPAKESFTKMVSLGKTLNGAAQKRLRTTRGAISFLFALKMEL